MLLVVRCSRFCWLRALTSRENSERPSGHLLYKVKSGMGLFKPWRHQFGLLIVVLLKIASSFAFTQTKSKYVRKINPLSMSPSIQEDTSLSSIPNWRLTPSDLEDYDEHLAGRPAWANEQYQESLSLYEAFMNCTDSYVNTGIKDALNTLDHAYRLYGHHSVICSFNGGKDAVVILHLVRAAHANFCNVTGEDPIRPRVIYFDHPDEFPAVLSFLRECVDICDLDMIAFEKGVKFSDGLKILVHNNLLPGSTITFPMGFVLGTRSSDPNAKGQDHFAPSSHYMPPFMRVNPVLDWSYGHVWHFLRLFQLPYCSLYDQGYTSLGTTKDTLPCPALAVNTSQADGAPSLLPKFWPAYMLRDWDQERAGRIKKEKAGGSNPPKTSEAAIPRTVSTVSTISDIRQSDPIMKPEISEGGFKKNSLADDSTIFTMDSDFSVQKSVGILIIGDEILKGLTVDQNTNTAAKALRKECVRLARVVVVSDDQDAIVKDIQRLQNEVDVIITSGGVGPTHDDVTIKSVAASLNHDLELHEEMATLLKEKMNNKDGDLTPAQKKMAMLPSNAKLRYLSSQEDDWPVLQCRNIFILPGVPEYFSKKIENVAAYLSSQLERSSVRLVLSVDEASIVDALNEAVSKHPNVSFGSYPFVSHPEFKTVLTLEGSLLEANDDEHRSRASRNSRIFYRNDVTTSKEVRDQNVRLALDDLITLLPKESILRVENDDLSPLT
jgi:FAD synthetase